MSCCVQVSRLKVGEKVKLAASVTDSNLLKPGDVGELVADDGSGIPFKVLFNGKRHWYSEDRIVRASMSPSVPAAENSPPTASFSHPWHVHNLQFTTKSTAWICDGEHAPGGCRGNGGGSGARYRCLSTSTCDYDLCQACKDVGKVIQPYP